MLQKRLRGQVHPEGCSTRIRWLAAADVAYSRGEDWAWAGAVLFRYPELEPLEEEHLRFQISSPYVPGFLSFREGPGLLKVLSRLGGTPDLILFDGQGRAHPQGLGLASHLGVLLRTPTIGCVKGRFVGDFEESDLGIAEDPGFH